MNDFTADNLKIFIDCVLVIDDLVEQLNGKIKQFFSTGRHFKSQMIVMCHKPAELDNMACASADTIYIKLIKKRSLITSISLLF